MQHYRSLEETHYSNAWVTIGSFDGVHQGHQALIGQLVEAAHAAGNPAIVITFFPHPLRVLRGMSGPFYLSTLDQRAELLGKLGADAVFTLPFNRELANQSAQEFMQALSTHLGIKHLWVGQDFALGRGREGNVTRLAELGESMAYEVEVIPPVKNDGEIISSSQIRALLQAGSVESAAEKLGRWYSVSGPVVRGDARGRELGFPTANLEVWDEQIIPASGIYATFAWVDGQRYLAATNVGVRPTFETEPVDPRVEPHLLDFSADLYGKLLEVEFVKRLRPELRYESVDALLEQMHRDVMDTKEVLSHVP